MDKVVLSTQDIETLLAWRDEHKAQVRSYPAPLKSVKIVCNDSGYTIKGIRNGNDLSLYLNKDGKSLGHVEFSILSFGMVASQKNRMIATKDEVQSVLTVYCSLMALMAYGELEPDESESLKERTAHKPHNGTRKRASSRTTYILRKDNGRLLVAPRGSHASPRGTFNVRGHYRHYKNGKVVWIAEYRKGSGKKKSKTYKMGGKNQ